MEYELPTFPEEDSSNSKILKKQVAPTICRVCLGKANYHHYSVASCDACKMFFRRTTLRKRRYTCKFNNQCFEILQIGEPEPKCRACRFKKCIEVGMKSSAIQIRKLSKTIEEQSGELIDQMIQLDLQSEKFRDCAFNPHHFPSLKECVKRESSMISIVDRHGAVQRNTFQQENIDQFMHEWVLFEVLIQIELAKALPFFSKLSESDRFYLAQDTVLMSTHLTRAFYSYEQKSDRLIRPDGIGYYDQPLQLNDQFWVCLRDDISMRCLKAILRNGIDRVEFVLLRVLVLTNPGIPALSLDAQNFLTKERQNYNIALFRYIMAKHGASGPAKFANILGYIDVLEHQQRDHRDLSSFVGLTKPRNRDFTLRDDIMKH